MRKAGLISLILFLAVLSFAQDESDPNILLPRRRNASDFSR